MRRAVVIVAALALAGCGGGGGKSATVHKAAAPGGDEEPIRVPATFTLNGGRLSPATISVPAFLTVRLAVVGHDERSHQVVAQTDKGPRTLRVPPGASAAIDIRGMRRGTYRVSVDGGRAVGKLVVGVNPGP
jgi:Cupredoxin-like domain